MKTKFLVLFFVLCGFTRFERLNIVKAESTTNITGLGYSINTIKSEIIAPENVLIGSPIFNENWLNTQVQLAKQNYIETIYTQTSYETGTSFKEIYQNMSSHLAVDVNVPLFSKNISVGFNINANQDYKYYASQYYYNLDVLAVRSGYALPNYSSNLTEYKNHLHPTFLSALDSVFSGNASFATLFEIYGTHVIARAEYGGKTSLYYSVLSNQVDVGGEFSATLDAKFKQGITATANFDLRKIVQEQTGEYKEKMSLKAYGGEAFSALSLADFYSKYYSWLSSINNNPSQNVLVNVNGFIPLWDLLPSNYDTTTNKERMKNAFIQYAQQNQINLDTYLPLPVVGSPLSYGSLNTKYRMAEKRVTDNPDFSKQPYDIIDLNTFGDYSPKVLRSNGYKTLTITCKITLKEIDDGYQRFYIFDGEATESNDLIFFLEYEHGPGKKNTSYGNLTFSQTITLNELKNSKLYIRYGARGSGADDWMNKDLCVKIDYEK